MTHSKIATELPLCLHRETTNHCNRLCNKCPRTKRAAASGRRTVEIHCRRSGVSKVSGDLLTAKRVVWVLGRTFLRRAATLCLQRITAHGAAAS